MTDGPGATDLRLPYVSGEQLSHQPYSRGKLIHELFGQRAAERPEAVALIHGDLTVTYGELRDRARRFAGQLARAGVGPGHLVPVVMPRSVDLVVAFLAVLMRGAAYAALDPRWPDPRLARLIAALKSPAVVTREERLGHLADAIAPSPGDAPCSPADAAGSVDGDSPASVFFTSGTTGEPKGAVSPHKGTVRLFQDCTFATFDETTLMPLTAAVPWDALTLELWAVLLNGGCSVVVDEPYLLPARLDELVARHGVNTVHFTSSLFNMFVDESVQSFAPLSQVLVGGERVSGGHLERVLHRFPRLHLVHCYGPVESTLFAATRRVEPADCRRPDGVPLGSPVPNTGLHVWDGKRLCGPDEVGELLISGDGLAVRYLDDAEETARRFPTMTIGGVDLRVYRSGDLAHWSTDGTLHFDGRADRQVKVRGHRIEPAEIEQAALTVGGVGECAAVPVPGTGGAYDGILLAYTSRVFPPTAESALLDTLRAQLPPHLVPAEAVRVEALPLTANGKMDSAALLTLRRAPSGSEVRTGSADLDDLTMTVAGVVASVLGLAEVSPDRDVVSMGGTSLDLGVICTRLAGRLGVPVPISEVVGRSSVNELVELLRGVAPAAEAASGEESLPPHVAALTGMQETFLLRQVLYPSDLTGLCPLGWWATGPVDEEALHKALVDVQSRHEALRARYGIDERYHDDQPVAVVDPTGPVPELRQLEAGSDQQAVTLLRDTLLRPLDIEDGRLWRAALVRVAESDRALFGVVVHHVAFDGRSEHILIRDLSAAYNARLAGRTPIFEGTPVGMAGTAAMLRALRARAEVPAHRRRWRELLRDLPELALPTPRPGAGREQRIERSSGASCVPLNRTFRLSPDEVAAVARLARAYDVTPFTVWLAAFGAAVRTVTGQDDFGIGVPTSSREGVALTDTVGCLIDVVCLRIRPSTADWDQLVAEAQRTLREALSMQSVPLTDVVRLINPPRTGRDPLYQVMLVYQDSARETLRLGATHTEAMRVPSVQATSEVVTELYPRADGGMDVEVTYQGDRVAHTFADDVTEALRQVVRRGAQPATHP
ncbi:AMP-binding protein [Micromonospora sediminicola]|uniref:AMP-binding protein n=1 Tax=Micromonospora sediminicola TaxID=946078 RepID=UPI00378E0414